MKKNSLIFTAVIFALLNNAKAQTYCDVNTANAYTMNMPGITNFQLNTIDRTSGSVECSSTNCNSYVNTGLSTSLEQGKTYTVSITHSQDGVYFPGARNNIRVWIDYDNNGTLDDAGETAVSLIKTSGTNSATFTVPLNAALGSTRMRVTAKMSIDGGHTLPTPCDNPADPLGYHGEIEDYTVDIIAPTGIDNLLSQNQQIQIYPNPLATSCIIKIDEAIHLQNAELKIHDFLGREVLVSEIINSQFEIKRNNLTRGIYFYQIINQGETIDVGKLVIQE